MNRRGFQLAEVLVALALAAGPALLALNLINSNAAGSQYNQEQVTTRLILSDLVEFLCRGSAEDLKKLARATDKAWFKDLLDDRTARLPLTVRSKYASQLVGVPDRLTLTLDENVDHQPGLFRISLSASLHNGTRIKVKRLFRPAPASTPAGKV